MSRWFLSLYNSVLYRIILPWYQLCFCFKAISGDAKMERKEGRRITFTSKGVVEILGFDAGRPQEGQVLMETVATAVSPGTELSRLYNTHMVPKPFPQNTGYLNCSKVLEIGSGVAGFAIGDLCIANFGHLSHLCVGVDRVTKVPVGVSPELASFTNLMSVSMRAVRQAEIVLGGSVLIFGLGLIGQFAQLFSRLNGASRVVCVDPSERRREIARQTGLVNVFDSFDPDLENKINAVVGTEQFDSVFDSTGVSQVIGSLPKYVRNYGNLIILGGVHKPVELDLYTHIQKRSLRLIGAGSPDPHNYPYDTEEKNQKSILELMQNGSLDIKPLLTHEVPVERAPELYRMLHEEKDKALGVVFKW